MESARSFQMAEEDWQHDRGELSRSDHFLQIIRSHLESDEQALKGLSTPQKAGSHNHFDTYPTLEKKGMLTPHFRGQAEFAKTFNTGLGMVMVVGKDKASLAIEELRSAGETVWQVGELAERTGEGCVVENMGIWA